MSEGGNDLEQAVPERHEGPAALHLEVPEEAGGWWNKECHGNGKCSEGANVARSDA